MYIYTHTYISDVLTNTHHDHDTFVRSHGLARRALALDRHHPNTYIYAYKYIYIYTHIHIYTYAYISCAAKHPSRS